MRTLIIAEAGVNHNGNLKLAKQLIQKAALAGADYVKFQTFSAEKLVTLNAPKADYQTANMKDGDSSQYKMLKALEIPKEWYPDLISWANTCGIKFFSTAFDLASIEFLDNLGMELFKIPSGEITNKPYLKRVASKQKPVILSTGMATIQEIEDALTVLSENGIAKSNITILHCTTEYPTPMEEVNLNAMLQIEKYFNTSIGYSDHTQGIEVPVAAVALGAKVIEKHFTLDCTLPGPDHIASLEPTELKEMVKCIRNIEKAIAGTGIKAPTKSELKNRKVARKSIVAAKEISKGDLFTEDNLDVKRPGTGLSPMNWDEVIGKIAPKDFNIDELITL
ncbi:N-acetylneuraminate synthase [Labilibacter marinus]|uniref:N-acetylneuraminate synthase n=1 Tax=Labilibacter marinus TaxID=1477105 RepID=UPI000950291E|nr:N-acetylneuraminate synthase [Labilibacter marinus]